MFAIEPSNSGALSFSSEKKFLSFQLGTKDTALLPLESVAELFQASVADILAVPQVPDCVLGIYNWREEMLWLVDLNLLTGFPPLQERDEPLLNLMVMVVQAQGQFMGLAVQQVKDIEVLNVEQIKPPTGGLFNREILPFLQGYFIDANNEILRALNAEAIMQNHLWQGKTNDL